MEMFVPTERRHAYMDMAGFRIAGLLRALARQSRPMWRSAIAGLLGTTLITAMALPARATAIASASISLHDLRIAPESGVLVFADADGNGSPDPWTLSMFGGAHDNMGQSGQFNFSRPGPGSLTAFVDGTYAGLTTRARDPSVTTPAPNASVAASSDATIVGCVPVDARAEGVASVMHAFKITGGTGDVLVSFGATVDSLLEVMTDQCGLFAQTRVLYSLSINGEELWMGQLSLAVGPDAQDFLSHQSLSADLPSVYHVLEFDKFYDIDIGVRSESHAANMPEPAVAALGLVGFILMQIARARPRYARARLAESS